MIIIILTSQIFLKIVADLILQRLFAQFLMDLPTSGRINQFEN
jgi:hypothetical protein